MNNDILTTILKDTYSLTQLKHRVFLLKTKLLQQFFGSVEKLEVLDAEDSDWLKFLSSDFYKIFDKDNVYQIFEDLEKQISTLKILTLYLTFEPNNGTLIKIGEKARKISGNLTLLLDIKYDPRLIAGASLVWNGLYRDYSLRARIEERKMLILENFKKFLR